MDAEHLRRYVIRPALEHIGAYSPAAEELLVATAAQESNGGEFLHQVGGGPAIGIFQMEPATHDDIWINYLRYREDLRGAISALLVGPLPEAEQMAGNLYYAAAMARCHYLRVPEPLPDPGNIQAMGHYWKRHYNTALGAGTVAEFVNSWRGYA